MFEQIHKLNQDEVTQTFRNHGCQFVGIINSICGSWRQSTVGDYLEHVSLFSDYLFIICRI